MSKAGQDASEWETEGLTLTDVILWQKQLHINRKISMIFPLVSCCSCVNNPSSF